MNYLKRMREREKEKEKNFNKLSYEKKNYFYLKLDDIKKNEYFFNSSIFLLKYIVFLFIFLALFSIILPFPESTQMKIEVLKSSQQVFFFLGYIFLLDSIFTFFL